MGPNGSCWWEKTDEGNGILMDEINALLACLDEDKNCENYRTYKRKGFTDKEKALIEILDIWVLDRIYSLDNSLEMLEKHFLPLVDECPKLIGDVKDMRTKLNNIKDVYTHREYERLNLENSELIEAYSYDRFYSFIHENPVVFSYIILEKKLRGLEEKKKKTE